ncbi:biotin-dependent carboxyltransferase family protein [Desulfatirhabdium butyrativorans]|uniref:5-oxoprolinase subunit C family protein n=1 Tax=Desulfatirhabdium butyrativorans TaxID=340467 RepID=UPI0003F9F67F|nr:biotin-dependent carboxyltransferase family protein [Desulfatirhabdium butyrativorans]
MIHILEPGVLSTVQDLGRYGFQDRGVPVSGAMDVFSLRVGNALVGNEAHAAGIEISFGGFIADFGSDLVFSLTGAKAPARLNQESIPFWHSINAQCGDRLWIGTAPKGARILLCVAGGIDVPAVMGSRSTYLKAAFGGYKGRALKPGDRLCCGKPHHRPLPRLDPGLIPEYGGYIQVRAVPGPQDHAFTAEALERFFTSGYTVTPRSDRMGLMLEGPLLAHRAGADILSDGILPGSVQVPGSGQPIVLMADRQTIGGYAKIATVISVDISRLAQTLPGDRVRFEPIDAFEAREISLRETFRLRQWALGVRTDGLD